MTVNPKTISIVRRIDDFGRIVIPKEIRRTCHLRDYDPIEIYVTEDKQIILRRYIPETEVTDN